MINLNGNLSDSYGFSESRTNDPMMKKIKENIESAASSIDDAKDSPKYHATIMLQTLRNDTAAAVDYIRRVGSGILFYNDLDFNFLVNKIQDCRLMAPRYWLIPCLDALSAWINNDRNRANEQIQQALRCNNVKASLYFTLVCCRWKRKKAAYKWLEYYLNLQDAYSINFEMILLFDAYCNGLLSVDCQKLMEKYIDKWLEQLSANPNFRNEQVQKWSNVLDSFDEPPGDIFIFTKGACHQADSIKNCLAKAKINKNFFNYINKIFNEKHKVEITDIQLEKLIKKLLNDFESEELEFRIKKTFYEALVEYNGNIEKAKKETLQRTQYFKYKMNFIEMLTNISINPQIAKVTGNTQKVAISLSKNFLLEAYKDIIVNYNYNNPKEITFEWNPNFSISTVDGSNYDVCLNNFHKFANNNKEKEYAKHKHSFMNKVSGIISIVFILWAIIVVLPHFHLLDIVFALFLLWCSRLFGKPYLNRKAEIKQIYDDLDNAFQEITDEFKNILGEFLSDVVDYRMNFAKEHQESEKVLDFIKNLKANNFISTQDIKRKIII